MIKGIEFRLLDSSEVKNGMLSDKKQKSFFGNLEGRN